MHQNFSPWWDWSQALDHPWTAQHQGKGVTSGLTIRPHPHHSSLLNEPPDLTISFKLSEELKVELSRIAPSQPCPEISALDCAGLRWIFITKLKAHLKTAVRFFSCVCEKSRGLQRRFVALATTSCAIYRSPGANAKLGETQKFWQSFAFKVGFV